MMWEVGENDKQKYYNRCREDNLKVKTLVEQGDREAPLLTKSLTRYCHVIPKCLMNHSRHRLEVSVASLALDASFSWASCI